jgi:hypothetical protein
MSAAQPTAAPTLITTLFGGGPTQTDTPSQGSIYLYKSNNCTSLLSDTATPLILGNCLNMPISDIASVEINFLPACDDFGTPLLLVSDQLDCRNSTHGTGADSGETLTCLTFGGGEVKVSLGSVEFKCYGSGISSVPPSTAANSAACTTAVFAGSSPCAGSLGNSSSISSGSSSSCSGCWALLVLPVLGVVLGLYIISR